MIFDKYDTINNRLPRYVIFIYISSLYPCSVSKNKFILPSQINIFMNTLKICLCYQQEENTISSHHNKLDTGVIIGVHFTTREKLDTINCQQRTSVFCKLSHQKKNL